VEVGGEDAPLPGLSITGSPGKGYNSGMMSCPASAADEECAHGAGIAARGCWNGAPPSGSFFPGRGGQVGEVPVRCHRPGPSPDLSRQSAAGSRSCSLSRGSAASPLRRPHGRILVAVRPGTTSSRVGILCLATRDR